jgi:acylphosphatase
MNDNGSTATPLRRARVIVSGEVQGVFFRDTCRRLAIEQGVRGWVRNLRDGRVEAVFEGSADRVERLVRWTGHGPRQATVKDIEVYEEEPRSLAGFAILPTE